MAIHFPDEKLAHSKFFVNETCQPFYVSSSANIAYWCYYTHAQWANMHCTAVHGQAKFSFV